MAGIYIHIPFCRDACTYCDFQSICGAGAADRTKAKKTSNPVEFGVVDRLKEYE